MRKYDGRVSSLDTLVQHTTGERTIPTSRGREKNSARSKKYLLLFLLAAFIGTISFFLTRTYRNEGTPGAEPPGTPLPQADNDITKEKRPAAKKTALKTETAVTVNPEQPQKSRVTIIENPQTGKSKGPVDFGTSLQLIAPK